MTTRYAVLRTVVGVVAGLAASLLVTERVLALDPALSMQAGTCQWAAALRFDQSCSGVYVGNGVVLTAAHCLYNYQGGTATIKNATSIQIDFGEDKDSPEQTPNVQACQPYPGGVPFLTPSLLAGYDGVDLAFCIIDDPSPDVASIPPMVSDGCAAAWLSKRVNGVGPDFQRATSVGFGNLLDGKKRFSGVDFDVLGQNASKELLFRRQQKVPGNSGVIQGDSGGPIYVKLPDSTWRLIGVVHSPDDGSGFEAQAVPPYLRWIEKTSCRDITPCHTYNVATSRFEYTGCPTGGLSVEPMLVQDEWATGCSGPTGGPGPAAVDACEGWPLGLSDHLLAPTE